MIADTSFLVALFIVEDHLHDKALTKLETLKSSRIIISDRVLEETFTVLTYKKGIEYALTIIEKINKNKEFDIHKLDREEGNFIIELAIKIRKKISFVDYSVIYTFLKIREELLCFDEDLLKIVKSLR